MIKYAAWLEFLSSFPDESVSDLELLILLDRMDDLDDEDEEVEEVDDD